ncbi:MAG: hypothetical protein EOS36_10795 [Mesorhizobium sp.]|uniref:hypothetical protein n=1 Tax=Mesorhizobium sp. TaxID=1871066 RepID=UPI000FE631AD|nr:hypothetical protein [Mesorhizobium sp.]RWD64147.1 MAG: hypothetical protein EOS36_10795 [Mesorhizobium sp.]RWE49290.1 MAG: hypothetical protein EOS79_07705 [Mesorhizobium sp.]
MNMHVAAETGWRFEIDSLVTHIDQPMPSIVMGRAKTSRGDEIYAVRSLAIEDPNRDRMMLGEVLQPIDDESWNVCLLAGTPLDPRLAG